MTTQHTKGPWLLTKTGKKDFAVQSDIAGKIIAQVFGSKKSEDYTDEDWANARLIASAPELLKELETCLAVFSHHMSGRRINRIFKLITKAKGEV